MTSGFFFKIKSALKEPFQDIEDILKKNYVTERCCRTGIPKKFSRIVGLSA
jgi:hypothetical protein